jgi:renalase
MYQPSSSHCLAVMLSRVFALVAIFSAVSSLLVVAAMSTTLQSRAARQTSVAILGSGISGSTAARQLAEAGMKVTVFECGFGVGGRSATRITRDEHTFAFDHGAQYIGQPKTESFGQALTEWQEAGSVREWQGRVADMTASGECLDGGSKRRYVGYPKMNSICTNLLQHDNIAIVLQTRACATYHDDEGQWALTSHGDSRELGQYDWLIASDRLSATNNRADLRDAPLPRFKSEVESISSVPILVLMVALDAPLKHVKYDGITFDEESGEFGSLGWIARDTSKPGRERDDGKECWVIQSGSKSAERILASTEAYSIDEKDFEKKRALVRERAKEILLQDFMAAIPKLSVLYDDDSSIPRVVSAVGHRWSAAFPSVTKANQEKDAFVDIEQYKFIACGDYIGKLTGRVEGAYLTGAAAAAALLDAAVRQDD